MGRECFYDMGILFLANSPETIECSRLMRPHQTSPVSAAISIIHRMAFVTGICFLSILFHATNSISAAPSFPEQPGTYPADDGKGLIVVGRGKIPDGLRQDRAQRLGVLIADKDARKRLAFHLYPEEMRKGGVSLSISGLETLWQGTAPNAPGMMQIVLRANPAAARLVPSNPLDVCLDVRTESFLPVFLERAPQLMKGGGLVFDNNGGWLALGVGLAPLSAQTETSIRAVARINAEKAMTEAVYGATLAVSEMHRQVHAQGPGAAILQDWASQQIREDIAGAFARSRIAGEWQTLDGFVAVAVVVARPEPAFEAGILEHADAMDEPKGLNLPEEWRQPVLSRPWLHRGGLGLCENGKNLWILVVEGGNVTGNPVHDRTQLPLMVETKARSAAVRYLSGFTMSARTVDQEDHFFDGIANRAKVSQKFHSLAKEEVLGAVSGMTKLGNWLSDDEKTQYFVFGIPLTQEQ